MEQFMDDEPTEAQPMEVTEGKVMLNLRLVNCNT